MVGFQGNFDLFAQAFPNDLVPSVFKLSVAAGGWSIFARWPGESPRA